MKTDSAVVDGSTYLVTDTDGRSTREHDGFYHRDTQHLDRYDLDVDGRTLESLEIGAPRPSERTVHLATALSGGARSLYVRRRQLVSDGLYERLRVRNLATNARSETLSLSLGTAFRDLFEVRGHAATRSRPVDVEIRADGVTFRYDPDDLSRGWETTVTATRGTFSDARRAPHRGDVTLDLDLDLDARAETVVTLAVEPDASAVDPVRAFDAARGAVRERERDWDRTTTELTRSGWDRVLAESRENLATLRLETDHGPTVAAGVPWFATAFGRDSLIAAYQALPLTTDLAKGTCRYLAARQATSVDEFREAEPGKIMHEVRHGEAALRGTVPHSPYYGSIDATALFVTLVHETWRLTGDAAFATELWEHVERALRWCDEYGDRDGDGFLEYPTDRAGGGLVHQAWKDSGDGITHPDGRHPDGPLAAAEVQGYYYDAKRRAADLARQVVGDAERARRLDAEAADLAAAFDDAFWLHGESFYAIALDGNGDPIETVASNPGHCLWSGLVPEERADAVVDRLLGDDMFSGWGIRTISSAHRAYNPESYHLGSVWPHDTSLVALGMARYGRRDAAATVSRALIDAAIARGNDRLPELFAGFDREATSVPLPYGSACEPQAWAAGAPIACLRAVEGEDLWSGSVAPDG
ncbi:glycogen debranching N-terminal domain-containing protein [Halomarina pelagica]|uniref:glycogen debranching N-terminal domain-containing protein n=1 Tax=Halomarina pelagica TaxID=2961599 RepID=UPI0020C4D2AD|nr:glycogen debranching N-terminal domain-containing protein [Halomarina sp. BND7]